MSRQESTDLEIGYWPTEDLTARPLQLKAISDRSHRRRSLYVLLVHGFNVRRWNAEFDFDKFRRNSQKGIRSTFSRNMLSLSWPGKMSHWTAVLVAKSSADLLADFLKELADRHARNEDCHVVLIGHSLGCRVILEALKMLQDTTVGSRPGRIDIFLMAPAVPVHLLAEGQPLRNAAAQARKRGVFHSRSDMVLRMLFPRGQTIAGADDPQEGVYPEAVGFAGQPEPLWTDRHSVRHGHGRYWANSDIPPLIGASLGLSTRRALPCRRLPTRHLSNRE